MTAPEPKPGLASSPSSGLARPVGSGVRRWLAYIVLPAPLMAAAQALVGFWGSPPEWLSIRYQDEPLGIISESMHYLVSPMHEKLVLGVSLTFAVTLALAYYFLHVIAIGRIERRFAEAGVASEDIDRISSRILFPNFLWIANLWMALHQNTYHWTVGLTLLCVILVLEGAIAWFHLRERADADRLFGPRIAHGALLGIAWYFTCGVLYLFEINGRGAGPAQRTIALLAAPCFLWIAWAYFLLRPGQSDKLFSRARRTLLASVPFAFLLLIKFIAISPSVVAGYWAGIVLAGVAVWFAAGRSGEPSAGDVRKLGGRIVDFVLVPLFIMAFAFRFEPLAQCFSQIDDALLYSDSWWFMSERGQFLEWAQRMSMGQVIGQDFFCLYGPYYIGYFSLMMGVLGDRYTSYLLAEYLLRFAGLLGLYFGLRLSIRSRILVWFLWIPWSHPRDGLGILGLGLLISYLRTGRRSWLLASALLAGFLFLFSQEMGLCLAGAGVLALCLRNAKSGSLLTSVRDAALFGFGLMVLSLPYLIYIGTQDALVPFLDNLYQYPRFAVRGFGFRPYPSIAEGLPPRVWGIELLRQVYDMRDIGNVFRFYVVPALIIFGVVGALPGLLKRPGRWSRHDLILLTATAFALVHFQRALARSEFINLERTLGSALIVFAIMADVAWRSWRSRSRLGPHASAPVVPVLAGVFISVWILGGGLDRIASVASVGYLRTTRTRILKTDPPEPTEFTAIHRELAQFIDEHTEPEDPILMMPNHAALYFTLNRTNPTRFGVLSQMITEAYREEALGDLARAKPKYVIRSYRAGLTLDGIPDGAQLPQIVDYVEANYREVERYGEIAVLERRVAPRPGPVGGEIRRVWDFDSGLGEWAIVEGLDMALAEAPDPGAGALALATTAVGGHMRIQTGAIRADYVEIRMRVRHNSYGQLMWLTENDDHWEAEEKGRAFRTFTDNEWHVYRIDLRFFIESRGGDIHFTQFDLTPSKSKGTVVEIDWIRLGGRRSDEPPGAVVGGLSQED